MHTTKYRAHVIYNIPSIEIFITKKSIPPNLLSPLRHYMFQYQQQRKQSMQESIEIQENILLDGMFPRNENFSTEDTQNLLKSHFNPKKHLRQILNYLYRCHKPKLKGFFKAWAQENNLSVEAPLISTFYSNDCFVSLEKLGEYWKEFYEPKQKSTVTNSSQKDNSSSNNKAMPQKFQHQHQHIGEYSLSLKQQLNLIFEQKGYIPNLQIFLLSYPEYLQKFLTLRAHLFEQSRIDNKIAYFLGFLACTELGSIYGMQRMLEQYLSVGGEHEWISQGKYPSKIRILLKLNRMLGRCLWAIDEQLIEEILESGLWTEGQLAVIVEIITFSQMMGTIGLAVGLECESKTVGGGGLQCSDLLLSSVLKIDMGAFLKMKEIYNEQFIESNQSQKLSSVLQNLDKNSDDENIYQSQEDYQKYKKIRQKIKSERELNNNAKRSFKKQQRRSQNDESIENYMRQIGQQLSEQTLYMKFFKYFPEKLLPLYLPIEKRNDKDHPVRDSVDYDFKAKIFPILYNLTNKAAEQVLDLINYSEIMTSNKQFCKIYRGFDEKMRGIHLWVNE